MNDLLNVSTAKLQRILALKKQIERLEARLSNLAGSVNSAPSATTPRKRRKLSAAARKRISDAVKARWARQKAAKK